MKSEDQRRSETMREMLETIEGWEGNPEGIGEDVLEVAELRAVEIVTMLGGPTAYFRLIYRGEDLVGAEYVSTGARETGSEPAVVLNIGTDRGEYIADLVGIA